jgi:small-conductance mechanosensitive channel
VIIPVIAVLGLVILARGILDAAHYDVTILDAAMRLVGAYIVIRVAVLLFAASFGNKSWMQNLENRLTLALWLAFAADYLGWLDPIINVLDNIGIASGKTRVTVWSVLKLLFTLTLFVLVAAWISRWIDRRLKKLHTLAPSTRIGLAKFSNAFLIGLSILVGLNTAGVDLTALTVLTGAIGLGLGFGLQSIASNFVSGFVLLMDRSIKPGDVISLSGQSGTSTENFGWVQELRGRYVVVRDRDGIEMLVPNQQLIANAVINWSYTDPRIRLKLPIRVSYQDDPELALKILLDACEGQRRVLRDPPPVSRLMHFGDHGIELELRFWISDPQEGVNNVRSEVNRTIWALFKEHNITIPVAQREIYVRALPPNLG